MQGEVTAIRAMVAGTGVYVLILVLYADPDVGVIGTGYLGLALLGAALLALGVFTSSLTRNQVIAALLGTSISVALWLLDIVSPAFGPGAHDLFSALSPSGHFINLAEGLIDTHDLAYYVSVTFVFLFLAGQVLETQRWRG